MYKKIQIATETAPENNIAPFLEMPAPSDSHKSQRKENRNAETVNPVIGTNTTSNPILVAKEKETLCLAISCKKIFNLISLRQRLPFKRYPTPPKVIIHSVILARKAGPGSPPIISAVAKRSLIICEYHPIPAIRIKKNPAHKSRKHSDLFILDACF
jgi:hypothetical protein